jgi:hypothetical protein
MNDGSIAPQQDVWQHEGKALLPSAFARLNGKSAVHQQIILADVRAEAARGR